VMDCCRYSGIGLWAGNIILRAERLRAPALLRQLVPFLLAFGRLV
jgi:hypothetical protein